LIGLQIAAAFAAGSPESDSVVAVSLAVIVRERGRCSIPEAVVIEPISAAYLMPPPARGMTMEFEVLQS
jgi:hypothetical protein